MSERGRLSSCCEHLLCTGGEVLVDVTTDSIADHQAPPLMAITEVGGWEELEVPPTSGTELASYTAVPASLQ